MVRETRDRQHQLLMVTGAGSFVILLAAISGMRLGVGPAVPMKVAVGLLAAIALTSSLLAIPGARRTPGIVETEGDDAPERPDEEALFLLYRLERLLALGFPAEIARSLALHPSVSIHDIATLVAKGCPPTTAARIVWPV